MGVQIGGALSVCNGSVRTFDKPPLPHRNGGEGVLSVAALAAL